MPALQADLPPRRLRNFFAFCRLQSKEEGQMSERKKNPNKIPDAHAEEDRNTPGDDTGDQCENIKGKQKSGPVAPTPPHAEHPE